MWAYKTLFIFVKCLKFWLLKFSLYMKIEDINYANEVQYFQKLSNHTTYWLFCIFSGSHKTEILTKGTKKSWFLINPYKFYPDSLQSKLIYI